MSEKTVNMVLLSIIITIAGMAYGMFNQQKTISLQTEAIKNNFELIEKHQSILKTVSTVDDIQTKILAMLVKDCTKKGL